LEIDNRVVIVSKERIGLSGSHDFGDVFLSFLPRHSFGYKILQRTQPQILTVNHEWRDKIEYVVEPEDKDLQRFFTQTWDKQMYERIVPSRSLPKEGIAAIKATFDIVRSVFNSKILR
jgi:hypothetical protein